MLMKLKLSEDLTVRPSSSLFSMITLRLTLDHTGAFDFTLVPLCRFVSEFSQFWLLTLEIGTCKLENHAIICNNLQ